MFFFLARLHVQCVEEKGSMTEALSGGAAASFILFDVDKQSRLALAYFVEI